MDIIIDIRLFGLTAMVTRWTKRSYNLKFNASEGLEIDAGRLNLVIQKE